MINHNDKDRSYKHNKNLINLYEKTEKFLRSDQAYNEKNIDVIRSLLEPETSDLEVGKKFQEILHIDAKKQEQDAVYLAQSCDGVGEVLQELSL